MTARHLGILSYVAIVTGFSSGVLPVPEAKAQSATYEPPKEIVYRIGETPFNPDTIGQFEPSDGPAGGGFFEGFIEAKLKPNSKTEYTWSNWLINIYNKGQGNAPDEKLFRFASTEALYLAGYNGGPPITVDWSVNGSVPLAPNSPGQIFGLSQNQAPFLGAYDPSLPLNSDTDGNRYDPSSPRLETNAGCFNSPAAAAAISFGNIYFSAPGGFGPGQACSSESFTDADGTSPGPDAYDPIITDPEPINGGAFSLLDDINQDGNTSPRWINFAQRQIFNFKSGQSTESEWQFLRVPVTLGGYVLDDGSCTGIVAGTDCIGDPLSLRFTPDPQNGQQRPTGWSSLQFDPTADQGNGVGTLPLLANDESPYTCSAINDNSQFIGSCPYTSNQQRNSSVNPDTGAEITVVDEIPAPLPLVGAFPLGVALKKMSKRRRELIQTI